MKAQASTETTIIIAGAFIVLIALFGIYDRVFTSYAGQQEVSKANALVDDVANAAQQVYTQAPGARTRLFITVPQHVDNITFDNNTIIIRLQVAGGQRLVFRSLPFAIAGNISSVDGSKWIAVEARENYVAVYPTS